MSARSSRKYFIISALFHLGILLAIVLTIEFAAPLIVVENTNKQDVISAVVLGDTVKSKIMPEKITPKPPAPEPKKPVVVEKKPTEATPPKPKVVEKAIALKKPVEKKKISDLLEKNLLAELEKEKKETTKLKKEKQKQLQAERQKKLRDLAEKTMRRNLLNEDIHLKSTQSHDSQGIVNKYQALILQALSEHWVIPPGTNRKLVSVLRIRLAPGGTVLDVQIARSSGDPALDRSARAAVMKASPLPVPTASADFELFRDITMNMKPENIQDDRITG